MGWERWMQGETMAEKEIANIHLTEQDKFTNRY